VLATLRGPLRGPLMGVLVTTLPSTFWRYGALFLEQKSSKKRFQNRPKFPSVLAQKRAQNSDMGILGNLTGLRPVSRPLFDPKNESKIQLFWTQKGPKNMVFSHRKWSSAGYKTFQETSKKRSWNVVYPSLWTKISQHFRSKSHKKWWCNLFWVASHPK